jgi:Flp pilus assembly protein TadD
MLGVAIAFAWCLWRWPGRVTYVIALLILIVFAVYSRLQTAHWRDSGTCYRHSLAVNPKSWWLTDGLGWHLLESNKPAEAIEQLNRAAELAPGYAAVHAHLGAAYAETANVSEAVAHFEKSLAIDSNQPRTHIFLGDIQALRGLHDEAAQHYTIAARQAPNDPVAQERLKRVPPAQ